MDELSKYRSIIDYIDKELIRLFEQRMKTAHKIGLYKKDRGIQIYHEDRENQVIEKCMKLLETNEFEGETIDFVKNIMKISVDYQNTLVKEQ